MATKYWFPIRKEALTATHPRAAQSPFGSVQREMERMFGQMFNETGAGTAIANKPAFQPDIDIVDEKTHLRVTAELPGMASEDVEVEVHEGTLVMKGEKKTQETTEEEGYYRNERSFGAFQRVIPLPEDVDGNNAEARFENGVLTIRLPKIAPKQAKKIEIK